MTIEGYLFASISKLTRAGIDTARLDTLTLLADILSVEKSWLLAHPEYQLSSKQLTSLNSAIDRRTAHEPLAYIRGFAEFYGRRFIVTNKTLQPRPETETMIELVLDHLKGRKTEDIQLIDIGTGTGCIALTIALEAPMLKNNIVALDIALSALEIAKKNQEQLKTAIQFLQSDLVELFEPCAKNLIVCANLPYVPDNHPVGPALQHEPSIALYGGNDGLDLYRKLFSQLREERFGSVNSITVFTESLEGQKTILEKIASENGFVLHKTKGLISVFR